MEPDRCERDTAEAQCRGLQIEEDVEFEHAMWRVQRAGRWLIAVLILVSMLGLFGGGVLSRTTSESRDGLLSVTHERFARLLTDDTLRVEWDARHIDENQQVRLRLSGPKLDEFSIQRVTPQPAAVQAGEGTLTYLLHAHPSDDRGVAVFALRLSRMGPMTLEIAAGEDGASEVEVWQFIYP